MYPEPYIDEQTWSQLRREIETHGFEQDPILSAAYDRPVYGINLAIGWPIPSPLQEPYERLKDVLLSLGPGIYVYPHQQTHITIMTLVNFKAHQNPTKEEKEALEQLIPAIISVLSPLMSPESTLRLKPFKIDVGPPVLSRRAAFLPILNPTQEISRLRDAATSVLHQIPLLNIEVPNAIHSTILRFLSRPLDVLAFISAFESRVANFRLGQAIVNEFLLTAETRPYMREGKILYHFKLRE